MLAWAASAARVVAAGKVPAAAAAAAAAAVGGGEGAGSAGAGWAFGQNSLMTPPFHNKYKVILGYNL